MSTHYPIITWTTDQTSGTVSIDGGAASGTTQNINDTGLIAWEPAAIAGRTDPHLWEHLAALINAETGTHGVTVTGYQWHVQAFSINLLSYSTPIPRVEMQVTTSSQSTAPELSFDDIATARRFGFDSIDVTAVPRVPAGAGPNYTGWSFITSVIPDGLLSFGTASRDYDDTPGYNASRTRSPHNPSAFVTVQHSTVQRWPIVWKGAPMRHKSRYYAALSDFASVAGTSTDDTNGTLQGLIDADQDDDRDFWVWLDSSTAKKVSLDWAGPVVSVDTFAVQSAFGNQRMDVSLPFIEVS